MVVEEDLGQLRLNELKSFLVIQVYPNTLFVTRKASSISITALGTVKKIRVLRLVITYSPQKSGYEKENKELHEQTNGQL